MVNICRQVGVCAFVVLLVLSLAAMSFGQVVTGTILGRVTDASGAVLAGAMVQINNVDTGFTQAATTDSEGRFLTRNLPLGAYTVTFQQTGFRSEERRGISLSVGSEVTVNAELAVGNVQDKVDVTAEAAAIETTNATISGLVSSDQMRDLPLNGRDLNTLALLSPGVLYNPVTVLNASLGLGISLSFNGGRPNSNLFLLDGTDVRDHSTGGPGSAANVQLGVEGTLEFRVLTHNFSAEYGHVSGAVISRVTRSGTNAFHGSAYEFLRNNVFDARNFFNPGGLPAFRRNQFGASAGGRIIKDRLFFFVNYEGLRQRKGVTTISSVPDTNARAGFLPCAVAPSAACDSSTGLAKVTLNPAVVPYLNLYPVQNGVEQGDGGAKYIFNFSAKANDDYYMERVDYRLSDKDNLFVRYVFDPSQGITPRAFPNFSDVAANTNHFAVLTETHVFSASAVNEARISFNRSHPNVQIGIANPVDPALSFAPGQAFGTILATASAAANTSQFSELGTTSASPQDYTMNLFQESDTLSIVRGAHSLKFGLELARTQQNNVENGSIRGIYTFAGGLQSLLAGTPSQFAFRLGANGFRAWRRTFMGWFVQDDIRLSPRLTLNVGLRHEFFTTGTEANGKMGNLLTDTSPAFTPGPAVYTPKANFSPRVGVAWDPFGNGKTSVRAGAGLFFNHLDGRNWYMGPTADSDYQQSYTITSNPVFPNGLASGIPAGALQSVSSWTLHTDTPTVIHYNVEVQRELAKNLTLRAGYLGSYGYNEPYETYGNIRVSTTLPDGTQFWPAGQPATNPNFSAIMRYNTAGEYNYNGLQVVLQKSLSAGLTFQASYTFSKTMSNSDETGRSETTSTALTPMDQKDLNREYSLSAFDQRHTFVLSSSYKMPWDSLMSNKVAKGILGGWAINGILSNYTGLPLNIWDSFNNSRDGNVQAVDRPNLVPGFSNNPVSGTSAGCQGVPAGQQLGTVARWFDPCAFVLSPAGTYGNLGRNTVTLPGLFNLDSSLIKNTSISERMKLEFRAEFFNILNHASFLLPNNNLFSSNGSRNASAGVITATKNDNRDIQFGLKLVF